MLGKFARVGAAARSNIDYNGRFCMASAAAAAQRAFGIDRGLPFPLADIPGAEAILLVGGNPAETMPPLMQYFDEQQRARRQADRRRSARAPRPRRRRRCTCSSRRGPTRALANGLLHVAIRDRLIDDDFIAAAHRAASTRCAASSRPTGPTGSSASPACRRRRSSEAAHMLGEAATGDGAHRARARAAEPRRRQRARASSTWCWRWARPASRSAATAA